MKSIERRNPSEKIYSKNTVLQREFSLSKMSLISLILRMSALFSSKLMTRVGDQTV